MCSSPCPAGPRSEPLPARTPPRSGAAAAVPCPQPPLEPRCTGSCHRSFSVPHSALWSSVHCHFSFRGAVLVEKIELDPPVRRGCPAAGGPSGDGSATSGAVAAQPGRPSAGPRCLRAPLPSPRSATLRGWLTSAEWAGRCGWDFLCWRSAAPVPLPSLPAARVPLSPRRRDPHPPGSLLSGWIYIVMCKLQDAQQHWKEV